MSLSVLPLLVLRLVTILTLTPGVLARLNATETSQQIFLINDRLSATVNKSLGAIDKLSLDGQDLLGNFLNIPNTPGGSSGNGNNGIGPYLDCYCIPSGTWTPGSVAPTYKVFKGVDSSNVPYGGVVMSDTYTPTGQTLQMYWFLREGETGLHTFSRIYYYNKTTPFLRNLQEFRTLFRPNTPLWTHISSNEKLWAPLPSANATKNQITVQDATWYLGNSTNDPYVLQQADYFTKYHFADPWRDHDVHGMYSDGSTSDDGSTFGSWLVMNTKDTYYGGPLHSDLLVDGIVYNYLVSNHHGDGTPNITDGFDRTFGPQYYHFNRGNSSTTLQELRLDALQYASPFWNAAFYDDIKDYVPNYVPTNARGTFKAHVNLPAGATRPIAVLAQNRVDFQDNVQSLDYQYWGDIDPATGQISIPRVKTGLYRLTIYADGIFGEYTQDDIAVHAGKVETIKVNWHPESHGKEIWRIGTPDKSSGEYKHGNEVDKKHPNHPEQFRIYWGAYDFPTDFPNGVHFKVGESKEVEDMNYIHFSVFGGYANFNRPVPYYENVNNWTIQWNMTESQFRHAKEAVFTVQLAGAKTAAGNTDVFNSSQPFANLPYTVVVNGHELEPWVIPYYHSSSCGVRSAVVCYNIAHKFVFDTKHLLAGVNEFILSLPFNATDYESALMPRTTYVQYDALRLEVK